MARGNMNLYKSGKLGENAYDLQKGDISNLVKQALDINSWNKIDTNDSTQVQDRVNQYFMYCMNNDCRPAVSGLALALGIDRQTLYDWKSKRTRANDKHSDIIKKAYNLLEFLWEEYMQAGKINPASGCFLGKNNFGYHDDSKVTIEAITNAQPQKSVDEIAQEIETDIPET